MAFTDPNSYFNITNQNTPVGVGRRAGTELRYIRDVGQQIERFATPVKNAAARAKNKSTLYPAAKTNLVADQLKIVAQLIAGGLKTRIYIVNHSGFDTHSYQTQGGPQSDSPRHLARTTQHCDQCLPRRSQALGVEDRVGHDVLRIRTSYKVQQPVELTTALQHLSSSSVPTSRTVYLGTTQLFHRASPPKTTFRCNSTSEVSMPLSCVIGSVLIRLL
ncbi:MAG: hypothetical protein IPP80_10470 [Ignavibacteria bacterium]|nr:hypothetical protein [Ignavibacteria bacterium]